MQEYAQYGSVKAKDAMNRRLYNNQSFVLTAIYRVFVMIYRIFSDLEFSSKNLNRTVLGVCIFIFIRLSS
ncbi:hypothetical protein [Nostoc sp.]|uniref:hypothetical protein n=1 Tax=Nostoc sp. TaxID=1180 RepID=UPI002FFC5D2E